MQLNETKPSGIQLKSPQSSREVPIQCRGKGDLRGPNLKSIQNAYVFDQKVQFWSGRGWFEIAESEVHIKDI